MSTTSFDRRRVMEEQVATATPAERLLMIWERLVLEVERGGEALRRGDWEVANSALISAQQILVILSTTLDHRWEGAANLDPLYRWCWEQLVAANASKDQSRLEQVAGVLAKLHAAWRQAAGAPELAGVA